MSFRTCGLLPILLACTLASLLHASPLQSAPPAQSGAGLAPPPLPRSCGRGGTPIDDYDRAACCVSGYIYLNGAPVAGAEVTVSIGGRSVTVTTVAPAPGEPASFTVGLSDEPLLAQPGDTATITASAGGQTRARTFAVLTGGQQIDIALPQSAVAATWEQGSVEMDGRYYTALATDLARQRVVVFGGGWNDGLGGSGYRNDTWEWDGSIWVRQRTTTAPAARSHHAMAYDARRGRVVLFGGSNATGLLGDTWEWDGSQWLLREPAVSPPARSSPQLVYDSRRGRVLLLGGAGRLDDLWEWDGITWTQLSTGGMPTSRSGPPLATYDDARQVLVLVAFNFNQAVGAIQAETWEWDGTTWRQRFPVAAPPYGELRFAYNRATQHTVMTTFREADAFQPARLEIWEWDGTSWQVAANPVMPRTGHALAFDPIRQQMLLFGGFRTAQQSSGHAYAHTNESWAWDGRDWLQVFPRIRPDVQFRHVMVYDEERQSTLMYDGTYTWIWKGEVWSRLWPSRNGGLSGHPTMAYDSTRKRVLLLGSRNDGGVATTRLFAWDGLNWSPITTPTAPPPRQTPALAYDRLRDRLVLFGGSNSGFLTDTWEFDGTTWAQLTPPVSPPAYQGIHSAAFDEARGRVVLHGSSSQSLVWEWDGVTWTQVTPAVPFSRSYNGLVYDPSRRRVLSFGGYAGDIYAWDGTAWTQLAPVQPGLSRDEFAIAFDTGRNRLIINGGNLSNSAYSFAYDTWELDGGEWHEYLNDRMQPVGLRPALAYAHSGDSILFGGSSGTTFDPNTYRWQGNQWRRLPTRSSPSAREGVQLARNSDGSRLLLFGGRAPDGGYLADTWAWQGGDWAPLSPPAAPPARGFYGLTFDTRRGVWVLFGGQDAAHYLGDTWEFDGVAWARRDTALSPPPRANATLTYDVRRGMAVLVGGQNTDGLLDDVWEWDGSGWREATPVEHLSRRTGHGAVYDSVSGVVVVVGGSGPAGEILTDTWEWNGDAWTQRLLPTSLPAQRVQALAYDGQRGEVLAYVGATRTYLQHVLGAVANPLPVATIVQATPRDARQSLDTITLVGMGGDADATDVITAYRWTHNGRVIGEGPELRINASDLPLGVQTIGFEVLDNEGAWSQQVRQPLIIRDRDGRTTTGASWTLLVYAVGDNDLHLWMGENAATNGMLYRLGRAGALPNVQVGVLYDGPEGSDTWLYTLDEAGLWTRSRWQGKDEARMDEQATLQGFLQWGLNTFRTDHYALALVDHANGVVGFGQDHTSDGTGRAFLTPSELRSALQAATDDGARQIDIVVYDGCSFGLLEDAAIVAGLTHFVVASPNTGWGVFPYERYRQIAGGSPDPRALAGAIAQTYAAQVATAQLPYSITVLDMAAFAPLRDAVGALGDSLLTYIEADGVTRIAQLRSLRALVQKYDSGGSRQFLVDEEDSYVDLIDLARQLAATVDDAAVAAAAAAVEREAQAMVSFSASASGRFAVRGSRETIAVELGRAYGIGVYYPPRTTSDRNSAYVHYISNESFEITRDWGWSRFLVGGLPALGAGDPAPLASDSMIPPLIAADVEPRGGESRIVLTPMSGGTVTSPGGAAQAAFMSGSVTRDVSVELVEQTELPGALPEGATLVRLVRLSGYDGTGLPVATSRQPFRLTVAPAGTGVGGAPLADTTRTLLAWDGDGWVDLLPCLWCTVDLEAGVASVLSDRFTSFALVDLARTPATPPLTGPWAIYLPLVRAAR